MKTKQKAVANMLFIWLFLIVLNIRLCWHLRLVIHKC